MKRGQIKSFETIAVLLVFFFLLVFGVIFYAQFQQSSLKRQIDQNRQIHVVNTALKIANMPELDCALTSVRKQNCFDLLRMREMGALLSDPQIDVQTRLTYIQLFEFATINITALKEDGTVRESVVIYDNANVNVSFSKMRIPMQVFDPVEKRFDFGYVEVTVYEASAI